MINRSDPDIGKKIRPIMLGGLLNNPVLNYYSIEQTPTKNPWIALHDGTTKDALSLAKWELEIPSYGCGCQKFYAEYKAANLPDFSSPKAFFAWGVRLHNAVNRKLGKLEITLEEAYSIWRKTDGLDYKQNQPERS
jgi:hypothetical protein